MNIKPYWNYFKYVMEHKKNVFIECFNEGLYLRAFTHDMSKLKPSEFIPYARYFYIDKVQHKEEFEKAWVMHYRKNKHHWDHHVVRIGANRDKWVAYDMDMVDIREMICDWKAMGRKFGDTAQEFYLNNYNKICLSHDTRYQLECELGLVYDEDLTYHLGEVATMCIDEFQFNNVVYDIVKRYPKLNVYELVTRKDD